MPDIFKPLFNPNLLRARISAFSPTVTDRQREFARLWAKTAADPAFLKENEKPLQGQFLAEVFGELLGYTLPVGHLDAYDLKPESASSETPGGKTPDARLGFMGYERDLTRAVIELKAPGADLDAKQASHKNLTPVEQAFGYLAKFDDCRWVILSDFVTIRLYSKRRGQGYCHEFRIADLTEPRVLRELLFLLSRSRLLAEPPADSETDALLTDSCNQEEEITGKFYEEFSGIRQDLFDHMCAVNPAPEGTDVAEHRVDLLTAAQKILDRVLFICFCEDTGLLPHGVIAKAFEAAGAGFVATSRWEQLRGLFQAVDKGNPPAKINGYNGGLFRADPALDALAIADDALDGCLRLSAYDFATDVNVNILGHIFEQSITDLERIRATVRGEKVDAKKTKRKRAGVFYTPEYITRYIVEETVGRWLDDRFAELQAEHRPASVRGKHKKRAAETTMWRAYQDVLRHIKVIDPACGSGAFLVAAFDYLHAEFMRTNDRLTALRGGQPELFDLDKQILTQNLFGVDISSESVEITKLSLWLKTARPSKQLNDLDGNIKCGNSLVSPAPDLDPELAENAFHWQTQFADVFADGGFDCVVGNPPYIRQEWLSPFKEAFQSEFACFSGTADAYLYFFERGLEIVRPGGHLGFITSGTFVNANFAAPFRTWLPTVARYLRVVNFGENQPFADAEMVFPTISILEKEPGAGTYRTYFMRERIPDSIPDAVVTDGLDCDETVLARSEWRFQPAAVSALFDRVMTVGRSLKEVVEGRIYYGVKTGLNDAFIIDRATRDFLIAADPACEPVIRKMLRGQDLRPWYYQDEDRWLIFARRGIDIDSYPSVKAHLEQFREQLEPKPPGWMDRDENGRKRTWPGRKGGSYQWFEIQDSVDYYEAFDEPKILWPDIAKLPRFCWDEANCYVGNTGYILPGALWLLPVLQSRVLWFCISQISTALRLRGGHWQFRCISQFMTRLRIPDLGEDDRKRLAELGKAATEIARERYALQGKTSHRILTDLGKGDKGPNQALATWWKLDFPSFRKQLKKSLGAKIPLAERDDWENALAVWRTSHADFTARLVAIETEINTRVYRLFGLAKADIRLLEDHARHAMIDYPYGQP